jgi:hypothetical protein
MLPWLLNLLILMLLEIIECQNFYLCNTIPKTNQYTYLGIPFNESLELKPIMSKMNTKINYLVNSFHNFLSNKNAPFYFKTRILVFFVLSSVLYYAPLFGSNKSHSKKVQTALNRGMFWIFGFNNKSSNTTIYNYMSKKN